MRIFSLIIVTVVLFSQLSAQQSDQLKSLYKKQTRQFTMPDGVELATDIYLPIPKRNIKVPVNIQGVNVDSLTIFPKGEQYLVYDSVNGKPNPNPRQLPLIFNRTPYDKQTQQQLAVLSFLGYGIAVQDTRGRYASEGVYYPFISNGWKTAPYHPSFNNLLDKRSPGSPQNSNNYSDGSNSIKYILNNLKRGIDTDGDGQTDKTIPLSNGSIGMFGASASGYNQYRGAASLDPVPSDSPGLKCLLPLVATGEFHQSTGFHNFVYRKGLVESWLKEVVKANLGKDSSVIANDQSLTNSIHTVSDYPFDSVDKVAGKAIDHTTLHQYSTGKPGFYPTSPVRDEMDISRARLNTNGKGDPRGSVSRYTKMDVPTYHLTGWWDIFINGQIQTFDYINRHTDQKENLLVIGPWTHQTLGEQKVGDIEFPANVRNIIGKADLDEMSLGDLLNSELFLWYRNNLNQNDYQKIGEPKFVIRERNQWQNAGGVEYKAPSENYYIDYKTMLAFLSGNTSLKKFPVDVKGPLGNVTTRKIDIPALSSPIFQGLNFKAPNQPFNKSFEQIPKVRFYVPGPENEKGGNYWFMADSFPPQNAGIQKQKVYWLGGRALGINSASNEKHKDSFRHDPMEPVLTVGGNNMNVRTPDSTRNSQGPMNLKNYQNETLPKDHILEWETKTIADSLSLMGKPSMTMQFKSRYSEPSIMDKLTNTQFFVRIVDVYPDGREILVTEGAVNAFARKYTKQLVQQPEKNQKIPFPIDTVSFENIKTGKTYQLKFNLLPIAYTFGDGHKLKVVISSSNYPKYQVSPGLPMVDGEFFRWNFQDGQIKSHPTGVKNPRKLINSVVSGPNKTTFIKLPVYGKTLQVDSSRIDTSSANIREKGKTSPNVSIYPNPAENIANVDVSTNGSIDYCLFNAQGELVRCGNEAPSFTLKLQGLKPGVYFIRLKDKAGFQTVKRVVKQPL